MNFVTKISSTVEAVAKTTAILVGLLYAVGAFIVNTYLSSFGYYHFNLFRLSYVLAGTWAAIPFLISVFF